jgi:glycosyltransferase involved in cell wall biosynthesis
MAKRIMFLEATSSFGGSTISLYTLIKYLDKSKYHPIVVTVKQNRNRDYFLQQPRIDSCDHIQMRIYLPWTYNKIYNICNRLSHKVATIGRYIFWTTIVTGMDVCRFYILCKKWRIDCLHINSGYGYSLAPAIAAKLLKIPCVGHFRDLTYPYGALIKTSKKLIKYYIAVSKSVKDQMISAFNLDDNDVEIIWNGVDKVKYDFNVDESDIRKKYHLEGNKIFGILGRMIEWKGIKEFVQAADFVFKKVSNCKALIVGDGDEEYTLEIKVLAQSLGISNKIIFTGYQPDVVKYIKIMDVVVNASKRPEPLGRTLNEAMAMGKPVVANASGGSLEQVLDGVTGFLVTPCNPRQMGEAIVRIIEDKTLYLKMSMAARKRFEENFEATIHASKIESFYEKKVFGNAPGVWRRSSRQGR